MASLDIEDRMRLLTVLSCLVLAGCSSIIEDLPQKTDSAPLVATSAQDLKKAAAESKISDPLEVAGPIAANPISSAPWIICLRSGASEQSRRLVYSVFFKDGKRDSIRLSSIVDRCEAQAFLPLD
jgi:hypothetical protein